MEGERKDEQLVAVPELSSDAMASFFTELKRRNVFKVAVAYGIVAWLLLQVADTLLPAFRAPDWVMPIFALLLGTGFIVALFLAWAYEMTPEGLKAAADVQSTDSITQVTGQKLNYGILGLMALAIGFLVVDRFVLDGEVNTASVGRPVGTVSEMGSPSSAAPAASSVEIERYPINLGVTAPMGNVALYAEVAVSPDGSRFVYSANVDNTGTHVIHARPRPDRRATDTGNSRWPQAVFLS